MKLTIMAEGIEPLHLNPERPRGGVGSFWLADDGLEGWLGTPAVSEQVINGVLHDGDMWPQTLTQRARTITIRGIADAASALEASVLRDRINALVGKKLTIIGDDEQGPRQTEGYISDGPDITFAEHFFEHRMEFTIIITCPDPHKYGREVVYTPEEASSTGVFNAGNVGTYPRFHVEGGTYITILDGPHTVRVEGWNQTLDLDMKDMRASSGTVTEDNAFSIPPGRHALYCSSDGEVSIYLRSAWR